VAHLVERVAKSFHEVCIIISSLLLQFYHSFGFCCLLPFFLLLGFDNSLVSSVFLTLNSISLLLLLEFVLLSLPEHHRVLRSVVFLVHLSAGVSNRPSIVQDVYHCLHSVLLCPRRVEQHTGLRLLNLLGPCDFYV